MVWWVGGLGLGLVVMARRWVWLVAVVVVVVVVVVVCARWWYDERMEENLKGALRVIHGMLPWITCGKGHPLASPTQHVVAVLGVMPHAVIVVADHCRWHSSGVPVVARKARGSWWLGWLWWPGR